MILHTGNPNDSIQLQNLISRLNGRGAIEYLNNCHNFVLVMHRVYKILFNELRGELLTPVILFDPQNIDQYVTLLLMEMRNAVGEFSLSGA